MWILLASAALADDVEPGFDHTHAGWDTVIRDAVDGPAVDYDLLAARYRWHTVYLEAIAEAPVDSFARDEQLAFWINAYNALTLRLIVDEKPAGILDLDGGKVWDTRRWRVGGQELTLNQIEHERLRKLGDPRFHAAINCASKGCPPLPATAIRADTLDAQLDEAARAWVAHNAVVVNGDQVLVSRIFDWYGEDFPAGERDLPGVDGELENALWWASRYASPAVARKLTSGRVITAWAEYDWALNRK